MHTHQDHAYPADELMPLTCKGRVRGEDRNRGDIDDALGKYGTVASILFLRSLSLSRE